MSFLLLLLMTVTVYGDEATGGAADVCNTKECEEIGHRITEFMDEKEDRCQNFFKFSCEGYLQNGNYPNDHNLPYLINELHRLQFDRLQSMFKEEPDHDKNLYNTMKNMYNLCKDKGKIKEQGLEPLKNKLKEAGDWPLLKENWQEESWNFEDAEIGLRKGGFRYGSLIKVGIVQNKNNPQQYIIQIQPGQLLEVPESDHEFYESYKNKMIEVATQFGATKDHADEMEKALDFQNELVKKMPKEDGQGQLMTLKVLKSKVKWVDWIKLIKGVISDGIELTEDESVYVPHSLNYFNLLYHHIINNKRTAANAMFWQGIQELIYLEALPGEETARDEEGTRNSCLVSTSERFSLAFSYFYVKKYLPDENREEAKNIVDHIQQELLHDIDSLKWMDESTKTEASKKIHSLKKVVGYPDELKDIQKVEKAYEGLKIDQDDNYALAILAWNKWTKERSFKMLSKPVAETKYWISDYFWPRVTYSVLDNTLTIPASRLQPPFFNSKVPKYVNYAILGRLVGKYITEAIINQGTYYNSEGNFIPDSWWSRWTRTEFEFRQSCFVHEYKTYEYSPEQHLDSSKTVQYNMADQGAVKLAYNAYKKNYPDEKEKLPQVSSKYTTYQMFWLVGANVWCAKMDPKTLQDLIDYEGKAPPNLRVNAAYGSMEEFGNDFDCKYESQKYEFKEVKEEEKKEEEEKKDDSMPTQNPLNPFKRCHLW